MVVKQNVLLKVRLVKGDNTVYQTGSLLGLNPARVDDVTNARNGDRRLRNVGRQDDLASSRLCRREDLLLADVWQRRVQRQRDQLRHRPEGVRRRLLVMHDLPDLVSHRLDLVLAGQEHQDVFPENAAARLNKNHHR